MLLVDADQAESRHRREHGGARADHDRRLAGGDPLPLVPSLRVGQPRVEDRDPVAEAGLEAAEGLRGERDLRDEDDRASPALERRRAGLKVDLGLAAPRRTGEEQVRAAFVERGHDPVDRPPLRLREPLRLRLAAEPRCGLASLSAPHAQLRRDELERPCRRRAVVVGDPERQVDERRRQLVEDRFDRRDLDSRRRGRAWSPRPHRARPRARSGSRRRRLYRRRRAARR